MDSNRDKIEFMKWLINNFKHHNPSVNFLIDYIASHPNVIELVKFSDAAKYAPRGIFISYNRNNYQPFVYFKDNRSYTYSDQAFHDIRLNAMNKKDIYYIEIDIPDMYAELYRFNVYEDNPYAPKEHKQDDLFEKELNKISSSVKINQLRKQLDNSLENHNFEKAEYILNQIQQLKGE